MLEWSKVVYEVSLHRFWGVIRSIKAVSVFRFGDRKCRFREIAIRASFVYLTYLVCLMYFMYLMFLVYLCGWYLDIFGIFGIM